jgi:hypothetical protein
VNKIINIYAVPTETLIREWRFNGEKYSSEDPDTQALRAEIFRRQQADMEDWEHASNLVGWEAK